MCLDGLLSFQLNLALLLSSIMKYCMYDKIHKYILREKFNSTEKEVAVNITLTIYMFLCNSSTF